MKEKVKTLYNLLDLFSLPTLRLTMKKKRTKGTALVELSISGLFYDCNIFVQVYVVWSLFVNSTQTDRKEKCIIHCTKQETKNPIKTVYRVLANTESQQ